MHQEFDRARGVTYIGPRSFVACFAAVCAVFAAVVFGAAHLAESFEAPPSAASAPDPSDVSAHRPPVANVALPFAEPVAAAPPNSPAAAQRISGAASSIAAHGTFASSSAVNGMPRPAAARVRSGAAAGETPSGAAAPRRSLMPAGPVWRTVHGAVGRSAPTLTHRRPESIALHIGGAARTVQRGRAGIQLRRAAPPRPPQFAAAHIERMPQRLHADAGAQKAVSRPASRALLVPIAATTALNARGSLAPRAAAPATLFIAAPPAGDMPADSPGAQ